MPRRAEPTIRKYAYRREGGEPANEREHFMKCATCGHMIDCRDLGEVLEHEGPHEAPAKN